MYYIIMKKKIKNNHWDIMAKISNYLHNNIQTINNSKLFAGFVIIILNISSKFVTIKLPKTIESYLKNTFSKQILVFAIAWMGTRCIYIAFIITFIFTIFMEYFFNEESMFCILPNDFKDYHISLLDSEKVTDEDVKKAKDTLDKAKKQNENNGSGDNNSTNIINNN